MTPSVLRLIAIVFLIAAVVAGILNLHRVADLGMLWLTPLLLMVGAVFMILARRGSK
jgi:hypothetical protein